MHDMLMDDGHDLPKDGRSGFMIHHRINKVNVMRFTYKTLPLVARLRQFLFRIFLSETSIDVDGAVVLVATTTCEAIAAFAVATCAYKKVIRNATIGEVVNGSNFANTSFVKSTLPQFNNVEGAFVLRGALHRNESFNDFTLIFVLYCIILDLRGCTVDYGSQSFGVLALSKQHRQSGNTRHSNIL